MQTQRVVSWFSRSFAALAIALSAGVASAQEAAGQAMAMPGSGLRAELIQDITRLEQKYVSLADAMADKYDWRPGAGVRSVGEVYSHIAGANYIVPTFAGVAPPASMKAGSMDEAMASMQALEKETDGAKIRETLKHSFMHARHAIAHVSDEQLDGTTKMFGQDVTNRVVLTLLVSHMHEHLGQAIAYARSNGVTPPWSASE